MCQTMQGFRHFEGRFKSDGNNFQTPTLRGPKLNQIFELEHIWNGFDQIEQ